MTADQYELIDFGEGRKLESLAGYWIDRPSPAAVGTNRACPDLWSEASARFSAQTKQWDFRNPWPESLDVDCGDFRMPVQPKPFGHIGLFPEQAENWRWLVEIGRRLSRPRVVPGAVTSQLAGSQPDSMCEPGNADGAESWGLNLFGYTGASTMAMVASGLSVAHVDAAKPNVQACRQAAARNGWQDARIRFLVDDASKFVAREIRRGRRYHVVVLDPPAYGHSPRGKAWRIERDLWPLLDQCLQLTRFPLAMLVTGHSPEVDHEEIANFLRKHQRLQARWEIAGFHLESGRSTLRDRAGRLLDSGFFLRLCSAFQ